MAYDEQLAERVRDQLADVHGITEKAMFGGVAFLLEGNMAVGLTGDQLMVRVGRDDSDDALARPHTRPFDMTGRPMKGWILVAQEGLQDDDELRAWVRRGLAFAGSLAPKGWWPPVSALSGRQDLNLRPPGPQPGALPDCATPRGCLASGRRESNPP